MRKRSKRRATTKTDRDQLRNFIHVRVDRLMDARTWGLGACCFGAMDVYNAMFTEKQHDALLVLPRDIFETTRMLYIRGTHSNSRDKYESCSVTLPQPLPWPTTHLSDVHMNREFYPTFIEWAERRVRVQQEATRVRQGVLAVLNTATTYGQIRALWPSMEQFMPTDMREQLTKWKKSSASGVVEDAWNYSSDKLSYETAEYWLTEGMLFEGANDDTNESFSVY